MRPKSLRAVALLIHMCLVSVSSLAQYNFEPGVVVSDSGKAINGYIDFQDWTRNPEKIYFTTDVDSTPAVYNAFQIREFRVSGLSYISRYVDIDETPFKVPVVKVIPRKSRKDRVFLKVLVDDELSLYQYRDLRSNFYVEENGQITELISHEFVVLQRGRFAFVDTFKDEYIRQLKALDTDCEGVSMRKLDYNAERLSEYVTRCNLEPGEDYVNTSNIKAKRTPGAFRISPTVTAASYTVGYFETRTTPVEATDLSGNPEIIDFETRVIEQTTITALFVGLDFIYYLPGDLNRRAILASASFAPNAVSNNKLYPNVALANFSLGYRYKLRSYTFQPFLEGAVSVFLRNSPYYDVESQEQVIPGVRLGIGIEYKRLWAILRGELHNRRGAELLQNGVSLSAGFQF